MTESSDQNVEDILTGESNDYRIRKTYSSRTMLKRNKSYKVCWRNILGYINRYSMIAFLMFLFYFFRGRGGSVKMIVLCIVLECMAS